MHCYKAILLGKIRDPNEKIELVTVHIYGHISTEQLSATKYGVRGCTETKSRLRYWYLVGTQG